MIEFVCYVLDCFSSVTVEVLSATLEVKDETLIWYMAVWRMRRCILWKGLCQKTTATHQNSSHTDDQELFFSPPHVFFFVIVKSSCSASTL